MGKRRNEKSGFRYEGLTGVDDRHHESIGNIHTISALESLLAYVKTGYDPMQQEWVVRAGCVGTDPELFFPGHGEHGDEAKEICRGCPVMEPCREYAIRTPHTEGVWGGMTEQERRAERKIRGWKKTG